MFFFSSRRRHTRWPRDWSSDVCSSDLILQREIHRAHVLTVAAEVGFKQTAKARGFAGAGEIHKPLYGAAEAFESEQIGDGVEPEALKRKDEVLFAGGIDDAVDGELLLVGVQQKIADADGLAERDGGFLKEHPLVAIEPEVEAFENDLSALRIEICRPVDAQIPAAVEHGVDGEPQRVAIERGFVRATLHTRIGNDKVIQLAA